MGIKAQGREVMCQELTVSFWQNWEQKLGLQHSVSGLDFPCYFIWPSSTENTEFIKSLGLLKKRAAILEYISVFEVCQSDISKIKFLMCGLWEIYVWKVS